MARCCHGWRGWEGGWAVRGDGEIGFGNLSGDGDFTAVAPPFAFGGLSVSSIFCYAFSSEVCFLSTEQESVSLPGRVCIIYIEKRNCSCQHRNGSRKKCFQAHEWHCKRNNTHCFQIYFKIVIHRRIILLLQSQLQSTTPTQRSRYMLCLFGGFTGG